MPKIDKLLEIVGSAKASDLHMVAGSVPVIRVDGQLEKTRHRVLSNKEIQQLVYEILTDEQIRHFEKSGDLDLAYSSEGAARYRFNIYQTHTGIGVAVRLIPERPLDLAALGFAPAVGELAEAKSGLVLVTGPTNSGKTTTVDRIIDVFPAEQQQQISVMVADSLGGVLCQQLPRRADGHGRIVAYELMVRSTSVAGMIREHKTYQIPTAIQTGRKLGMQLLDSHLKEMVDGGLITVQEAIKQAADATRFSEVQSRYEKVGV